VNAGHLKHNAYLYIRQSTLRQVFENSDSTLRDFAATRSSLGLPPEQIVMIDNDLEGSPALQS